MSADLHCHSTFSDGTATPTEVVKLALEKGLKGLSITDHDTVSAYPELIEATKGTSLKIISGVEFSSAHRDTPIHILGYSFKLDHPKIIELVNFHTTRRIERNQQILKNLNAHGLKISLEDIKETMPTMTHQIGRAHIAYTLFKRGIVPSTQMVFQKWIGEGRPCYANSNHPSIEETIRIIHEAGGFAVIAHPHLIKQKSVLKAILKMKFDGIEARYALFPPHANQRFFDIAKDYKLFTTGGSDFHGEIRLQNPLGASVTDEALFDFLEETFRKNSLN